MRLDEATGDDVKGWIVVAVLASFLSSAAAQESTKSYKVVDPADLGIGSRKYYDKDIEVRGLSCLYADVDDYRCMSGEGVVIFTSRIANENGRSFVEQECDSIKIALSKKCTAVVRFSFTEEQVTRDTIDGYRKRTILRPASVMIAFPKQK